ncbi:methylated-DNA--[protein]-cysteine S-methyltransferase [Desertimonas flava]|uniref:methylated-DNA--[protein]-cysteine S-methyltransferase n=1 Tax=Desertimonas flava TaxID=2064846 RepID=UPI000E343559|nr:methylated-DNA--[protein]-cysteine S-methyltransferase [Desertimonas flava]
MPVDAATDVTTRAGAPRRHLVVDSPIGPLTLVAADGALVELRFANSPLAPGEGGAEDSGDPVLRQAADELDEYFAGERTDFGVPLAPRGTAFQLAAWKALREIPYGETVSYGDQARRLGDARKSRAVGAANGRNPIPIIVPCHRVIGANGSLTGFGGGIETKIWLLDHERGIRGGQATLF